MADSAHGCRLRTGRYSESGRIYLVTAVVKNREPFFSDFLVARLLVNELKRTHQERHITGVGCDAGSLSLADRAQARQSFNGDATDKITCCHEHRRCTRKPAQALAKGLSRPGNPL